MIMVNKIYLIRFLSNKTKPHKYTPFFFVKYFFDYPLVTSNETQQQFDNKNIIYIGVPDHKS